MIEYLIALFLIAFGVITSYEDFFYHRIRNRWVVLAILFGIVTSLTIQFFVNISSRVGTPHILEFYFNVLFAFLFGYLVWYSGLWSAGDAKLFIAYAFIIPPLMYKFGYIPHFPAFTILVNTFTPFLIFFLFYIPLKSKPALVKEILRMTLNPGLVLKLATFVFGFGWLVTLFFRLVGFQPNFFLNLILLFMIILFFSRFLKLRVFPVSVILGILRIGFEWSSVISLQTLTNLLLMMLVFLVLRIYLLSLSYELFTREIFIENLREGMIPAEDVYRLTEYKFRKRRFAHYSFLGALLTKSLSDSIFSSLGDGLGKREANFVKRIHSKGFLKDHTIRVYESLPFAPFMFLGAVITIVLGTDIIFYLRTLIERFI